MKEDLIGKETSGELNINCPACGCVNVNSWEMSDDYEECECPDCGATLAISRDVRVYYDAKVINVDNYEEE